MSGSDWWVLADIRSVQRFIFETDVLAQMRGASALVEGFDEFVEESAESEGGNVEIGLGGTYRVRFGSCASAKSFEQTITGSFEERVGLPATRLATVMLPAGGPAERATAYAALAEARGRRVAVVSTPLPVAERCQVCGRRPSTSSVWLPDGSTALACSVCTKRQEAAAPSPADARAGISRNLGEFARSSQPEGYIAVLVADGDGIGALISSVEDDADLSRKLGEATAGAVGAVAETPGPVVSQWVGGDDAVLVVRPQRALDAAATLVRTFSKGASQPDRHVTMSCGVVVTHASMPFSNILQLGEELLEEAKRARRAEGPDFNGAGFIDLEVTSSSSASGLAALRHERPARPLKIGSGTDDEVDLVIAALRELVGARASRALVRQIPAGAARSWGDDDKERWARVVSTLATTSARSGTPRSTESLEKAINADLGERLVHIYELVKG
jgi:hypothetical protein